MIKLCTFYNQCRNPKFFSGHGWVSNIIEMNWMPSWTLQACFKLSSVGEVGAKLHPLPATRWHLSEFCVTPHTGAVFQIRIRVLRNTQFEVTGVISLCKVTKRRSILEMRAVFFPPSADFEYASQADIANLYIPQCFAHYCCCFFPHYLQHDN